MQKKSNMLLVIGALAFLVGAALVASVLRSGDDGNTRASSGTVLVATEPIAAGTSGSELISKNKVTLRAVSTDTRASDVLTDPEQLRGRVIDVNVASGEQVRAQHLRPQTLRSSAIVIPPGKQGVAVQIPFVAGGAGYVGPGDLVDIYGNIAEAEDVPPTTKLVLGNIKVLDVSTEVAPRVASGESERPAGSNVTVLLALDAHEAERVIYLAANGELWITLAGDGTLPPTSGRTAGNVLR